MGGETDGTLVVLVVDDEPLPRWVTVETFRFLGCTVLEAANARTALDILGRHSEIDLLFSDIRMPGIDGIELARTTQQQRPGLAIVLSSAYTDKPVPAGVGFLPKPWRDGQINELVTEMRALAGRDGHRRSA